jgi:hypothetical protein
MQIQFTITKGHPPNDPGKTVPIQTFEQHLIPVSRLLTLDYGKDEPDHVNFMFEGGYQVWVFSESRTTRLTLKLPSAN